MDAINNHPRKINNLFSRPAIIGILLLIMVATVHFPLMKNFSRQTIPWAHPDNLYFCSVVEWNMHAFQHEWPALYHLNVLYPHSYVTFFGHPLYGESLFFLFAGQCLNLDIHRSIIAYMFFSFFMGGLGCFLLAREITGRIGIGYLGAFLFILNPFFYEISKQLNIQSFYWSGFILFFLVRLLRRPNWRNGFGIMFFCTIQGLFEIYHGFFIMGIAIPLFCIFSVAFKAINKKGLWILGASVLSGIGLNVLMYFPFPRAVQTFQLQRKKFLDFRSLIDATYLLSPATRSGRGHEPVFTFLLMGCCAMAFFIFGYLYRKKMAKWQWSAIMGLVLAGFLSGALGWVWGANALIFIFIGYFSYLVFHENPGLPVVWKICWGVLVLQLLVFFRFDGLIPGSSFSIFGLMVQLAPMISGLRYLYRGIFVLTPLLIALIAAGMAAAFDRFKPARYRWLALAFVLLVMRLEFGYWRSSQARLPLDAPPYESIEKDRDRVLIEFPFWGSGKIVHHGIYSVNSMFHHNYLVNGRVAFRTDAVYNVFRKSATTYAPPVKALPRLLEKYGVDYMILHWDLMRDKNLKTDEQIEQLRSQMAAATKFVKVLADEKRFMVLRLKENFPLLVVRRCYSAFHLARRDVVLELAEPYEKELHAFLTRKPEVTARVSRSAPDRIRLSFPDSGFNMKENPIEIHFEDPIELKDIRLEKKKGALQ